MTKILLIIPAYNEADSILTTVKRIEAFQAASDLDLDYLVINDGSTDEEEEILTAHEIPHIELLHNLGIGGAVQTGYRYALDNAYDIAVQLDGDGQHDVESLPKLVTPILSGQADFTVGSRFVKDSESSFKSSGSRRFGIRLISTLLHWVTGFNIYDVTSGFRAGNKAVIETFCDYYPKKYPEPESYVTLRRQNFHVAEIGVKMFERTSGKSSITLFKGAEYMLHMTFSILLAVMIEKKTERN